MKLLIIQIFIILTFPGYAQTSEPAHQVEYSKNNYVIEYPSNWKMDTSKLNGIEFTIFSPKENTEDKFSENINLIIQDLAGKSIDLDKYAQLSEEQIRTNAKDLKGLNKIKIGSEPNELFKFTFDMTYGAFTLNTEQYYFVKDEKAYVITFSSEKGKSKIIGQKILNSFKLIE